MLRGAPVEPVVGREADGADGGGAATPELLLYASTIACVTSVDWFAHITLLAWFETSSSNVKPFCWQ